MPKASALYLRAAPHALSPALVQECIGVLLAVHVPCHERVCDRLERLDARIHLELIQS